MVNVLEVFLLEALELVFDLFWLFLPFLLFIYELIDGLNILAVFGILWSLNVLVALLLLSIKL